MLSKESVDVTGVNNSIKMQKEKEKEKRELSQDPKSCKDIIHTIHECCDYNETK